MFTFLRTARNPLRLTPLLAAFDLCPPFAALEVRPRLLLGLFRDLNIIDHRARARRLRHPCRRAFVLHHRSPAFDRGHAAAGGEPESITPDFRFCEFCLDARLNLGVGQLHRRRGRRFLCGFGRTSARRLRGQSECEQEEREFHPK